MIRNALLAGAALTAFVGAASAADLPRRAEPPIFTPVPVFTWSGAYFGVNAGYAFSDNDRVLTTGIGALQNNVTPLNLRRPSVPLAQEGFTGGGQVGYNIQLTPGAGIVVGIEADAQYTDLSRTRVENQTNLAVNPNQIVNTYRTSLEYLGTVRGRIGYAFDRVLVYGTGGFAYGEVSSTVQFQTNAPVTYLGSRSRMETGYAYGGGIEYALPTDSFLNFFRSSAVTVRAEYLRYDLGVRTLLVASTGAPLSPGVGYNSRIATEGNIVRGAINYKF